MFQSSSSSQTMFYIGILNAVIVTALVVYSKLSEDKYIPEFLFKVKESDEIPELKMKTVADYIKNEDAGDEDVENADEDVENADEDVENADEDVENAYEANIQKDSKYEGVEEKMSFRTKKRKLFVNDITKRLNLIDKSIKALKYKIKNYEFYN